MDMQIFESFYLPRSSRFASGPAARGKRKAPRSGRGLLAAAVVGTGIVCSASTAFSAPMTFFGEDVCFGCINSSPPLTSWPNADAARADFAGSLTVLNNNSFETQTVGPTASLTESYPDGMGGTITATVSGNLDVRDAPINGAYAIDGSQYILSNNGAGGFSVDFSQPISGFGFFGTDFGDGLAQLQVNVTYVDDTTTPFVVPHTLQSGTNSGSVIFWGLVDRDKEFDRIVFSTTGGVASDGFGLDQMIAAEQSQLSEVPLPASLSLLVPGLLALG